MTNNHPLWNGAVMNKIRGAVRSVMLSTELEAPIPGSGFASKPNQASVIAERFSAAVKGFFDAFHARMIRRMANLVKIV